jgi:hypothetical protein
LGMDRMIGDGREEDGLMEISSASAGEYTLTPELDLDLTEQTKSPGSTIRSSLGLLGPARPTIKAGIRPPAGSRRFRPTANRPHSPRQAQAEDQVPPPQLPPPPVTPTHSRSPHTIPRTPTRAPTPLSASMARTPKRSTGQAITGMDTTPIRPSTLTPPLPRPISSHRPPRPPRRTTSILLCCRRRSARFYSLQRRRRCF